MSVEYNFDEKYCYSNTYVLKNKLDIRDANILYNAERDITSVNVAEIRLNPIKGSLNLEHLKKIHYHIFKDLYDWAGQERTVNISKGNTFCMYENIENYGNYIFQKLKKENYLINTAKDAIYDRFSFFMSEINALHPFREGNGRSQRVFMSYLARVAGYELNFKEVSREEMIELSSLAFRNGHEAYIKTFEKITKPISDKEQMNFICLIGMNSIVRINNKTLDSIRKDINRYKTSIKNDKNIKKEIKKDLER